MFLQLPTLKKVRLPITANGGIIIQMNNQPANEHNKEVNHTGGHPRHVAGFDHCP